jgi:phosphatidylglycerol lysyltransferase
MWKRAFAVLLFSLVLLIGWSPGRVIAQEDDEDESPIPKATVELSHARVIVRLYEPEETPRAIMVFGSGDGGWSAWEDSIAHWLVESGVYVVGLDLREYAEKDYNQELLGRDMARLAQEGVARCNGADSPIIYAGWSMGAVQAIAAAASNERPGRLAGVIMLSADDRGRYGLRKGDELGLTPRGAGTFGLEEFTSAVADLRVAQFHGGADFMASTAWIRTLKSKHALYVVPGANHGFDGPDDRFKTWLLLGVNWVLGDETAATPPIHEESPFGLTPLWPVAALSVVLVFVFMLSKKHSIRILALAMVMMGLVGLFESMIARSPSVLAWTRQWVPLGVTEKSRVLLLISSLVLFALARGLSRRKRIAWWLSVIVLGLSALLHLFQAFDWHHALAAFVLLMPLIRWRREFIARSDASSIRIALGLAVLFASGLFAYGAYGLHEFSDDHEFGEDLTWGECAAGSASALMLQRSEYDRDGSRDVKHFLRNLRGGVLMSSLLVLGLGLRPVLQRRVPMGSEEEREQVEKLIAAYGNDPMDSFATLPDKRYFFAEGQKGVVAYALWRNFAVALADPICAKEVRREMIHSFCRFARRQDWTPVFYCAHLANRALYEAEGLATFKIGEDARLKTEGFTLQGGKFQNLRTAGNRARKERMSFLWYQPEGDPDEHLEEQLSRISEAWLAAKHGGEMTFDLGAFDLADIRASGAAVVRNAEGVVQAFATWRSYHQGRGRVLDLMRGSVEARNGGLMDFLILESIHHFQQQGIEEISLGNAPLANVRLEGDGVLNRQEKATRFLFEHFDRYYGYKSLFSFKRKYHPDWQGRYLAYLPGTPLPMLGLAIGGVHLPNGFHALLKS